MLKIKKKTILLFKADACRYVYKTLSGCFKSYVVDAKGKEHILQFAPEEWFISDLDALINQKPSAIFIEAVEDTEYTRLSKEDFDTLDKSEQNLKLVNNLISLNNRLISLLSSTAEERFSVFKKTYPSLINRLPSKLIASYIGVTPEYLSEIRKRIVKY